MEYVYFLEVIADEDRSNSALFQLVQEVGTGEDRIFSDTSRSDRTELAAVIEKLRQGDILVIRSAMDLAEDIEGVCEVLLRLKEQGAELYSCAEPYLNGVNAYDLLNGVRQLETAFRLRKKYEGYRKAVAEKRVGRPRKDKSIAKAVQLYHAGALSIKEIELVTGISRTTLYKALNADRKEG